MVNLKSKAKFWSLTASAIGVLGVSGLAVLGGVKPAEAANIGRGTDYLSTPGGGLSSFDFGAGIGLVSFVGVPVGPGNTDTKIERQADCIFTAGSCTIPIEVTLLSMRSENAVDIGGQLFNVLVGLTQNVRSIGTMTINHEFPDNNTPAPEGTFTSDFTINFDAVFSPITGGTGFTISDSLRLINNGAEWSHEPAPGALLVRGDLGDQAANCHDSVSPLCARGTLRDFFPGRAVHGPSDRHVTVVATPEPLTILGSGAALGFGAFFKKRSRKSKKQALA